MQTLPCRQTLGAHSFFPAKSATGSATQILHPHPAHRASLRRISGHGPARHLADSGCAHARRKGKIPETAESGYPMKNGTRSSGDVHQLEHSGE